MKQHSSQSAGSVSRAKNPPSPTADSLLLQENTDTIVSPEVETEIDEQTVLQNRGVAPEQPEEPAPGCTVLFTDPKVTQISAEEEENSGSRAVWRGTMLVKRCDLGSCNL
ncbi:PREDICTED: uncharacterized protein LOC105556823 [Vollenhovia emeryi]|uniref:uncharacterized protein LOC105556823 n=1 Tax=Vollenhovia emeryi TaxID=411798 RepID=UPI0005F48D53|nr:PREDICTED: uncharacterized protein LOC105556823 [Vollenhovia emeryi]